MKTKLFLFLMALLGIAAGARSANVTINATNFPDENFRNWILAQGIGADGILTDAEIAEVTEIYVSNMDISDLKGIEFFTALSWVCISDNQLTTLDISKNVNIGFFDCSHNQLTTLDVSKNTDLATLMCDNNQLTTLDVSKNTILGTLYCENNQLTTLDVSKNTGLRELDCSYNQLTTLDVSKNTALRELYCNNNRIRGEAMQTLVNSLCDRSGTLQGILQVYNHETATGNEMTTDQVAAARAKNWRVDYSGVAVGLPINEENFPDENFRNWILDQDYGADGILTDEEIAGVTEIYVSYMDISDLSGIEFFTALENLDCFYNKLTALDVSKNTALAYLDCRCNQLTALDVSKNTGLVYLICSSNQLTALDVTKNTLLVYLDFQDNQLTALDVSQNWILHKLYCQNNQLTTLDVSKNTALSSLWCYQNKIRGEGMQMLVNSLCDRTSDETGELYVYNETADDNEMTTLQVAAAKAKNWRVLMSGDSDYPGIEPTVTLNKSEAAVEKDKTVTLTATVYPSSLSDRSVTWKSSKTSVATVTNKGVVKGIAGGIATITCTSVATGAKATCKVTVGKVSLGKSKVFVEKGSTLTLTGTVYPSTLEDRSVTWKSSNTSVATVTSDGMVTGVGGGTATITCTSVATGFTATCKVTVGKVSLSKYELAVEKDKTMTLTATVYPSSLSDRSVTWKSSKTSVATVTSDGKVTGVAGGTATITCTSVATGFTATCKVTVGKVSLSKYEVTMEKGKTTTLTATVYPSSLSDRSVTWKSSNTAVATVTSDGKVKGVAGGTATITCTSVATGFTATCKVTVGKVSLSKYEVAVEKGKTVTLTATVYPSSLENKSVTWKSSNTAVATVTSDGKVKGVAGGTATITCTSVATGFTATCQVTVTESANARTLDGDDDELTGIETVEETPAVEEPFDVYDLKGRKVLQRVTSLDGLPAGIYIVNGKKVLKK